ncbi:hypothetical protein GCM10009789_86640 [Kribbella sancticallisti]|uniref:Uncharacterized protein n=1 Tax=Kribbella sancticallisti TaxID=460087 RepID=A0ABP4QT79_9ACTN
MLSGREIVVLRRKIWMAGSGFLAVIGLVSAVLFINWLTALVVFLMPAFVVGSVYLSVLSVSEQVTRRLLGEVVRWAVRAGAGVLAISGYAASIGLATLPLVVLIAATAPLALAENSNQEQHPQPWLPVEPAGLTDAELCAAWQHSSAALSDTSAPESRQLLAELRRRYLDELERRHPQVFAKWLQAMPAAGVDLVDYYLRESGQGED